MIARAAVPLVLTAVSAAVGFGLGSTSLNLPLLVIVAVAATIALTAATTAALVALRAIARPHPPARPHPSVSVRLLEELEATFTITVRRPSTAGKSMPAPTSFRRIVRVLTAVAYLLRLLDRPAQGQAGEDDEEPRRDDS